MMLRIDTGVAVLQQANDRPSKKRADGGGLILVQEFLVCGMKLAIDLRVQLVRVGRRIIVAIELIGIGSLLGRGGAGW